MRTAEGQGLSSKIDRRSHSSRTKAFIGDVALVTQLAFGILGVSVDSSRQPIKF